MVSPVRVPPAADQDRPATGTHGSFPSAQPRLTQLRNEQSCAVEAASGPWHSRRVLAKGAFRRRDRPRQRTSAKKSPCAADPARAKGYWMT